MDLEVNALPIEPRRPPPYLTLFGSGEAGDGVCRMSHTTALSQRGHLCLQFVDKLKQLQESRHLCDLVFELKVGLYRHTLTHTCMHTHTYTETHIHTHACMHTHTHSCITHTHTHIPPHTHTRTNTHMHIHTYMHTHIQTDTHILLRASCTSSCECVCVCVCVCPLSGFLPVS